MLVIRPIRNPKSDAIDRTQTLSGLVVRPYERICYLFGCRLRCVQLQLRTSEAAVVCKRRGFRPRVAVLLLPQKSVTLSAGVSAGGERENVWQRHRTAEWQRSVFAIETKQRKRKEQQRFGAGGQRNGSECGRRVVIP